MAAEPFVDEQAGEPPVRGFLHRAPTGSGALRLRSGQALRLHAGEDVVVLTHGASGNCRGPLLVALAQAFAAAGVTVLRYDLPFRHARPSGPPSPGWAARDQAGIRRVVTLMKEMRAARVFAGGQSYGGRQTTLAAATEPGLVDGLLLLSYPLHPPGRPAQLRTAHFPDLRAPVLFVTGTKDPFGSIEEIETAMRLIPSRVEIVRVDGAGHSLVTKTNRERLPPAIVERFEGFFGTRA